MRTISINPNFFGKYNTQKELFKKVLDFVKNDLVGQKITINLNDKQMEVELTWQGLKNDLYEYHQPYIEKLLSFSKLPTILRNSKFIIKESEKNPKKQRDVKAIYKFLGKVSILKTDYDVLIIIKETSKTFIYDHVLIKNN
ncbi:MAG: hypothetical protein GX793_01545 [Bacteroidales bacterium]|jgi:hypothetical protein|nr:hypothetical protein [Bacteroidales bacterium]MCK9500179.1 hypothetical protein [Bacteroidales bacterium]MDY0314430.1 hypothetical protein [Bacteroidales bacterium]NLB85723.1 hypothetical protein [Bacteroidales bacterium]OQC46114.1 MAG: hypothetical protein BWX59_00663 [Bacteroidetes bacterium ADurb.Bin028]